MGWTGYYNLTADEAKAHEIGSSCDVIAKSGSWWLVVPHNEETRHKHPAILIKFLTRRHGKYEVAVKTMDVTMGVGVPPATIARKYLAYYDGDFERAGGHYGADDLRKAVAPKDKVMDLKPGDMFTIVGSPYTFTDGVKMDGDYTFVGRFIVGRLDNNKRYRMPKGFKQYITNRVPA